MAKKRGNGVGSITRCKEGLYMARYTVQTHTGTKRMTLYGSQQAAIFRSHYVRIRYMLPRLLRRTSSYDPAQDPE